MFLCCHGRFFQIIWHETYELLFQYVIGNLILLYVHVVLVLMSSRSDNGGQPSVTVSSEHDHLLDPVRVGCKQEPIGSRCHSVQCYSISPAQYYASCRLVNILKCKCIKTISDESTSRSPDVVFKYLVTAWCICITWCLLIFCWQPNIQMKSKQRISRYKITGSALKELVQIVLRQPP